MKSWIMLLAIVSAVGIAGAQSEEGVANFYGDKFQSKKTASGEVFDKDGLTAAHKKLPFGTKVKVTNVENDKSVVVTVNDHFRGGSDSLAAGAMLTAPLSRFETAFGQRFAIGHQAVFKIEVTATDSAGESVKLQWGTNKV